jgi:hypothetical protein
MRHRLSLLIATIASLFLSSPLMAGGPPLLRLPIDGVTSKGAQECIKRLDAELGNKIWRGDNQSQGVRIVSTSGQQYLSFYMQSDIRLSDLNAALKGTACSIPSERIRFFGHLMLEIDASPSSHKALVAGLEALPQLVVEESMSKGQLLVVTVAMPYPVNSQSADSANGDSAKFEWLDTPSSKDSRGPVTADELPGFKEICDVASKHDAKLSDIRWSTGFACRTVGAVAVQPSQSQREGTGARATR